MAKQVILVPDIGDYTDIPVIEVLVKVGDTIEKEQPLLVLESDKATMEIPADTAGTLTSIAVKAGDKVNKGSVIAEIEVSAPAEAPASVSASTSAPIPPPIAVPVSVPKAGQYQGKVDQECDVLVL